MYSSLQQQCLVELGITPFDLNDKYKAQLGYANSGETSYVNTGEKHRENSDEANLTTADVDHSTSTVNTSSAPQAPKTAPAYVKAAPVKAATPAESAPAMKKQAAVINVEDHWLSCTEKFITDIKAVFPNIIFSVLAFDAKVAILQDIDGKKVYWKIASKYVAQYVQQETIGQDILITSPLPHELTPAQKKELWLLIQPYSTQVADSQVADNQVASSNDSANHNPEPKRS